MASCVFNTNIFDGDGSHPMKFSGAPIRKMVYRHAGGDVTLFEEAAQQSSATFIADGTFTVPVGVSSVTVCMSGGGSGGGRAFAKGGYAGQVTSQTVAVTPNDVISVTVGLGGAGSSTTGGSGGLSAFGGSGDAWHLTATGGVGSSYDGRSAEQTSCGGTDNDGTFYTNGFASSSGGQSNGFGTGGTGRPQGYAGNGGNGGVGAGGGCTWYSDGYIGGAGGRGEVRITWTNFSATWSGSTIDSDGHGVITSGSNFRSANSGTWITANIDGTFSNASSLSPKDFWGYTSISAGGANGSTSTSIVAGTNNTASYYWGGSSEFIVGSGFQNSSIGGVPGFPVSNGVEASGGQIRAYGHGYGITITGNWITLD